MPISLPSGIFLKSLSDLPDPKVKPTLFIPSGWPVIWADKKGIDFMQNLVIVVSRLRTATKNERAKFDDLVTSHAAILSL
jgi:hypothetical protein